MVLRTLWPLPVGLADNGDGPRYLCQQNLVPAAPGAERYADYAIFDWVPALEPAVNCTIYPSSEIWVLQAVQRVTEMFGGAPGAMDLRWAILANAILIALLVGMFAFVVRRSLGIRIALSVLFLLVVGDPTFANYAGSVFGEFPGLVGVSLAAMGAIYLGTSGVKQIIGLFLFAAGSVLILTSKTQGITLLIPIAVFLLCTTLRVRARRENAAWWRPRRLVRILAGKVVPVAVAVGLLVPTMWVLDNNPREFQAINPWELISVGILGNSSDPGKDLVEMGFPEELEKYAGDNVWVEDSILNTPDWEQNKANMTYATAAKFLLAHPDRAFVIANNAGNDYFETRPNYLGTYSEDSGKSPREFDYSPLADLGRLLHGGGIIPLVLVWSLVVFGAIRVMRNSNAGSLRRSFARAAILMIGFSIVQFFTASFGEAIENTKHMVYGILAGALAPVFVIAGWLTVRPDEVAGAEPSIQYIR